MGLQTRPSIIPALFFLFTLFILSYSYPFFFLPLAQRNFVELLDFSRPPPARRLHKVTFRQIVKFISILLVPNIAWFLGQYERMMENKISKRCGFACAWRAYCTSGMVRQRLCVPRQNIRDTCIGRKSWGR